MRTRSTFERAPNRSRRIHSDETRDKPDLTLSSSQWEIFNGWKRPHELLSGIDPSHETDTTASMMPELSTVDLSQDVTTDCSVVASLCAATSRVERGHSQVFLSRPHYSRFNCAE